jgi:hypothetical protein
VAPTEDANEQRPVSHLVGCGCLGQAHLVSVDYDHQGWALRWPLWRELRHKHSTSVADPAGQRRGAGNSSCRGRFQSGTAVSRGGRADPHSFLADGAPP